MSAHAAPPEIRRINSARSIHPAAKAIAAAGVGLTLLCYVLMLCHGPPQPPALPPAAVLEKV